ncbi:MAG: hypothetical protein Kow0099_15950 [Candidatus Abyssubacteria bacterium]
MSEEDLKINSKIRRLFVEHNFDVSQLTISSTSGTVTVRGELMKLGLRQLKDHEIVRFLAVLETAALRTKGVKRVIFHLKGWEKEKGKWKKADAETR